MKKFVCFFSRPLFDADEAARAPDSCRLPRPPWESPCALSVNAFSATRRVAWSCGIQTSSQHTRHLQMACSKVGFVLSARDTSGNRSRLENTRKKRPKMGIFPDFPFWGYGFPIFWAGPISFPISGRRPKPIFLQAVWIASQARHSQLR